MDQNIHLGISYDDVLLIPNKSPVGSRSEVNLSTFISPRVKIELPLISINMLDVTGVDMAIKLGQLGGIGFLPRFMSSDEQSDMVEKVKKSSVPVGAAVGIRNGYIKRAEKLVSAGCDILTIDVAHGHLENALIATKTLKEKFGNSVDIISGVVATYEGAKDLFLHGADSVRVGVGPGTICTTRIVTGVGVPQITAVMNASRAAKELKKIILCDGGTKNSGDIAKGLAAGASAAIIGSQFAGCEEAPGKLIEMDGKKYKQYNASTSLSEKEKHIKNNVSKSKSYTKHIEGIESIVPYKGKVDRVIQSMVANLKSSFSYSGATNIEDLWKKAKFVRITSSGIRESGAHDVVVTEGVINGEK